MRRAAILLISILLRLATAAPAAAVICTSDTVPAATLLLPYFEVDLSNPNGETTLLSINNGSPQAVLVHVVIWSDLAVPVLAFHIYLTGYDVQAINLRDIIVGGQIPQTASAGQDPTDSISPRGAFSQDIDFPSCQGVLPPPPLPSFFTAHLQAALTGRPSLVLGGKCAGQALGDNLARGYITADTVSNCSLEFPGDVGYFAAGGSGDATDQNVLWGDWALVAPDASQGSQGGMLVPIEADASNPATSTSGRYTFYGRFDGFTAIDNREPLATLFATRYLIGFGNDTSLLVWRDPKVNQQPFTCPATPQTQPPWYPLGQEAMVVFDEQEHPSVVTAVPASPAPPGSTVAFGAATQRVHVGSASLPSPFSFGWLLVDLNTHVAQAASLPPVDSGAAQGWIFAAHAYPGFAFNYTTDAARFDSACAPQHFAVPPGGTGFFTLPPCRLVDTRNPAGPYGGPALAGGSLRAFDLAGQCGIPPTVKAVSLNVTVAAPTGSGDLRLFQGGIAAPNTSAISFPAGRTLANNAVIGITQDGHGTLDVLADMPSGVVDLILDVNGYFQ
jgi:hypothetical protein